MIEINDTAIAQDVAGVLQKLLAYCRQEDWAGYDPYDALNSELLKKFSILDSKYPRIALTQGLKLSPVNLRGLLGIPKTQNPKALALFLSSFLILSPEQLSGREELIKKMISLIVSKRSPDNHYWCWGYSFPWQTRKEVVPAGSANLVCTTFVGLSLMDSYERTGDAACLEMALSATEYIVDKLYWTQGEIASFSYPQPGVPSQTHNANFLAAALLCRVYKQTGEQKFLESALKVTRYSVSKQRADGSWDYGEVATQNWIDNFHTGYNLRALRLIGESIETKEFEESIRVGFKFYRAHFFREDGSVRYFHNRSYPIDIHCVAESIITLVALKDLDAGNVERAHSVFSWAIKHMWDERGFFYYRVLRFGTIQTSYMRWSQSWMLLALATLLNACANQKDMRPLSSAASSSDEVATEAEARG
jgi:hypothetical protein